MFIHRTAVVHPGAKIGANVSIGAFAVIEDETEIGDECQIMAHAVIKRYTTLGARNRIHEHATIGGEPQDVKFKGEASRLIIGDDNLIREFTTIHRAQGEGQATRIGARNFFMISTHIAHNCVIGDDNIFANGVALAGHITVEDRVFLSSNVGCHQFTRIGRLAMVGGKSKIVQDVLPFFTTDGNPPRVRGLNTVGLRRAGLTAEQRLELKRAYRTLFYSARPLREILDELAAHADANTRHLVNFIRASKRGFIGAERRTKNAERRTKNFDEIENNEQSIA